MKAKLLILTSLAILSLSACGGGGEASSSSSEASVVSAKDGSDGKDGSAGKDGTDGKDGSDGKDGQDGKDGADGKDGLDGKDGSDGKDGKDGLNGKDGVDGKDGADGKTPYIGSNQNWWIDGVDTGIPAFGADGQDGTDGKDGKDGQDGFIPYVGENGNWWIDGKDTGIQAIGKDAKAKHRVRFVGDEGELLYVDEVPDGEEAYYVGKTPKKDSTDEFEYAFTGWDIDLTNIKADTVATANFEPKTRAYEITFLDEDGKELENLSVLYGTMPMPKTPSKASDDMYDYTFRGWDHPLEPVAGVATYKAVFDKDYQPEYFTLGVDFRHNADNASFTVYSYEGAAKQVVIPDTFLGQPVTGIAKEAFQGNVEIESIHLGANIDDIEPYSFTNMSGLKSFSVSKNNPNYIARGRGELLAHAGETTYRMVAMPAAQEGMYVFDDDVIDSLEASFSATHLYILKGSINQITVGGRYYRLFAHVPSKMSTRVHDVIVDGGDIPEACFARDQYLTSLTILENEANPTTNINEYSFYKMAKLKSLVLPNSVETIRKKAMAGNSSLQELVIGANGQSKLTTVYPGALRDTRNIDTSLDNDENAEALTYIGNRYENSFQRLIAYKMDEDYKGYLAIPEEIIYIADHCFQGVSVNSFSFYPYLDTSLTSIGEYAFYNFKITSGMSKFLIPDQVERIGTDVVEATSDAIVTDTTTASAGLVKASGLKGENGYLKYISEFSNPTATHYNINIELAGHQEECFNALTNISSITTDTIQNKHYSVKEGKFIVYDDEMLIYTVQGTTGDFADFATLADITEFGPYAMFNTKIDYIELGHMVKVIDVNAMPRFSYSIKRWDCYNSLLCLGLRGMSNSIIGADCDILLHAAMIEVGAYAFGSERFSVPVTVKINDDAIPAYFDADAFRTNKTDPTCVITPILNADF